MRARARDVAVYVIRGGFADVAGADTGFDAATATGTTTTGADFVRKSFIGFGRCGTACWRGNALEKGFGGHAGCVERVTGDGGCSCSISRGGGAGRHEGEADGLTFGVCAVEFADC